MFPLAREWLTRMAPRVGEHRYQLFAHWGGFKGPPLFFSLWDRRTHECIGEVSVDLVLSLLERLITDGMIQAQFQGELGGAVPVVAAPLRKPSVEMPPRNPADSKERRAALRQQRRTRRKR